MKHFAIICVLFAVMVIVKSEELKAEYCKGQGTKGCISMKCNKDNTKVVEVPCPVVQCPGEIIGYKGNEFLPYPDCCIQPECREEGDEGVWYGIP